MKFEVNERYRHRNLGTVTITNRVGNFVYAHPSWADEDRGVVLTVEEAKELLQPIEEPSSRGEPQPQSWGITFDAGDDVPYSVSYWFGTKAEAELRLKGMRKVWEKDFWKVVSRSEPPTHQLLWCVTSDGVEIPPYDIHPTSKVYGSSGGLLPSQEVIPWAEPLSNSEHEGRWIWTHTKPPELNEEAASEPTRRSVWSGPCLDEGQTYLLRNATHTMVFRTREEAEIARTVVYPSNWEVVPSDDNAVPNTQLVWLEGADGLVLDGLERDILPTERYMGSQNYLLPPPVPGRTDRSVNFSPNTVNVCGTQLRTWSGHPIHTDRPYAPHLIEGPVRSYVSRSGYRFRTREEAEFALHTKEEVGTSSEEPDSQLLWVEDELGNVVKGAFSRWSPVTRSVTLRPSEKLFGSKDGLFPPWRGSIIERETFVEVKGLTHPAQFSGNTVHYSRDPMDFEHLGLTLSHHRVAELGPHIKGTEQGIQAAEEGIQAAKAMLNVVCSAPLTDNLDEVMPGLREELDRLNVRWSFLTYFEHPMDRAIQAYLVAIRAALLSLTWSNPMCGIYSNPARGLKIPKILLSQIYEVTRSERARLGLLRMDAIIQMNAELTRQGETEVIPETVKTTEEGSMASLFGILGAIAAFAGVASLTGRSASADMRVRAEGEPLHVPDDERTVERVLG